MLSPSALRTLRRSLPEGAKNQSRVAKAIELSGETQRQIAIDVGLTEPHLSDIARGRFQSIRMDTAHKLAAYFGCTVDDLFPAPTHDEVRAS